MANQFYHSKSKEDLQAGQERILWLDEQIKALSHENTLFLSKDVIEKFNKACNDVFPEFADK